MSIVDYCIIIWAVQTEIKLNKLQRKISRFLLKCFYPRLSKKCKMRNAKKVDLNDIYIMLNLNTITERRKIALLCLVWKNVNVNGSNK